MSWNSAALDAIWNKARPLAGNDPNVWRVDDCGAAIYRLAYGNRETRYGWEVDHIDPCGGDYLVNLRPLQWENNAAKSDSRQLVCAVTFDGTNNVPVGRVNRTA